MQSCPYQVNKRYIHTESGLPLTVKYVGLLPPTPTHKPDADSPTWIGVEWDDPKRGKHSGRYQDQQVFRTRVPGAASFLKFKAAKRTPSISGDVSQQTGMLDAGKGFFQAVYERYIDSQLQSDLPPTNPEEGTSISEGQSSGAVEKVVLGSSNGQIVVEMPNLDKIVRNLRKGADGAQADNGDVGLSIKEIGLDGEWVSGVDYEGDGASVSVEVRNSHWQTLRGKLNNVHTLNLSRNLIPNWIELARICVELPNLRVLVVNFSRMEPLQDGLRESLSRSLKSAFAKIEQLHVCHSLLKWTDTQLVTSAFPALRLLDLAGNPLLKDCLSPVVERKAEVNDLRGLQSLDLTDCGLTDWQEVLSILTQTSGLRALNISSNPVTKINLPASSAKLPALDTMIISGTRIQDWQSIDNLQHIFGSSLRTLKFSLAEELLTSDSATQSIPNAGRLKGTLEDRVYLISKLPALETLNGTKITPHERLDAERFYLAQAAKLGLVKDDPPGWGRLKELRSVHGESQNGPAIAFVTTTLKSKMIDIVIECPELGVEPFTLSLLPTAPLKLLKTKIARQLGVPVNSKFGLRVREAGMNEAREVADDDRTSVSSLDLAEGDAVLVEVL